MSAARHQVAIVGGGMVGAALALLLVQRARIPAAAILLLEPEPARPLPPGAAYELRVSAISPANRRLLQQLGAWALMDLSRVAAYERMAVWSESTPPDSPDVLRFDAAELGEPDLGSIVENRNLQAALLARCAAVGIAPLHSRLASLETSLEGVRLGLEGNTLDVELVVGADGANSAVRRLLGIGETVREYGERGIVATVSSERGHQHTAWQRFLSTGPLALLPLANGETSIVWSAQDAEATRLMDLPAAEFSEALTVASAGVLGRLTLTSARAAFALRRMTAKRFAGNRCALVGDAAHVIHPLAGQGVNEGLQDALCLAEVLAARPARESPGAERQLAAYARERRAGNAVTGAMMDALDGLFTGSGPVTRMVATAGMALVARSRLARRFFFTRAAGRRP
ncbi:MAG TPA: FAD-dependent monooxygenase [Steroidobacteraceae bacterium]|nr:FAD-dependent monooxygenase [Steroidobacteraceae bacterium]